jgi:hypothetical protein
LKRQDIRERERKSLFKRLERKRIEGLYRINLSSLSSSNLLNRLFCYFSSGVLFG